MLKAFFIVLTMILAATLFAGMSYAANKTIADQRKCRLFKIKFIAAVTLWLVYAGLMAGSNIFLNTSFPPRIPVLIVFPFFGFISYFFLSGRFRDLIAAVPLHWFIYFQTFRIMVELLLFGLFMEHLLPWSATFEGYNFDIGIGISAPLIGYLVCKRRLYKWAIRAWNITGLCTLLIVVIILNTYAYHPELLGQKETILGKGFGTFPFIFLASFFMPSAVFMHICVLSRLRQTAVNYFPVA